MPPTRRSDISARDLGSEMILYDESSETYHVLNDSARHIWLLLDGTRSGAAIRETFENLFPQVEKERLERDLDQALAEFARRGLLSSFAAAAM